LDWVEVGRLVSAKETINKTRIARMETREKSHRTRLTENQIGVLRHAGNEREGVIVNEVCKIEYKHAESSCVRTYMVCANMRDM
jgi:hypothetical protein